MRRANVHRLAFCGALAALALLGACGKKGDLKPPPGEHAAFTWPQQYPAPSTVVPGLEEEDDGRAPFAPQPLPIDEPPIVQEFGGPGALGRRDSDRSSTQIYSSQ